MIIGEAPGKTEDNLRQPFAGQSGKLLERWLRECGINKQDCILGNVFRFRPADNNPRNFFVSKTEIKQGAKFVPDLPEWSNGYKLRAHFHLEIVRIKRAIIKHQPRAVIAVGGMALWALTGQTKINEWIGQAFMVTIQHKGKAFRTNILPCWHPMFIRYSKAALEDAQSVFRRAAQNVRK